MAQTNVPSLAGFISPCPWLVEHQHVLGSACTWSQPQMASKATISFHLVLKRSFRNFINLQGVAGIVGGAASPLTTTLQKLIFSPSCVRTEPACLPMLPYLCYVHLKIIWRLAQGCIYFRVFLLAAGVHYTMHPHEQNYRAWTTFVQNSFGHAFSVGFIWQKCYQAEVFPSASDVN